jgi:hypothetical protein
MTKMTGQYMTPPKEAEPRIRCVSLCETRVNIALEATFVVLEPCLCLVNEGGKEVGETVGKAGRWNNMGHANRKPIRS